MAQASCQKLVQKIADRQFGQKKGKGLAAIIAGGLRKRMKLQNDVKLVWNSEAKQMLMIEETMAIQR